MRSTLFMIGSLAAACSKAPARDDGHSVSPATTHDSGAGSAATAAVAVPTARITLDGTAGPTVVVAEVVKSSGRVQKGLMFRKFLPADGGMLFLMGEDDDHHFWMHNTYIPLDIMFITEDLTVAGILVDVQPMDETSRGVGKTSRYVLEVNAGWSKRHGVAAGSTVHFDGVEAAAL